MASYRLCNTAESSEAALQVLSKVETVYLDCEGVQLGAEGGSLALVSLGAVLKKDNGTEALAIFLIDILALGGPNSEDMASLRALLEGKSPTKVMFDCRMDASEFFHGFNIRLDGVVDLQLADMLSRPKRREGLGSDRQLQRLNGFVPPGEVQRNRAKYSHIIRLNGLDSALREHGIMTTRKQNIDHNQWLSRPLRSEYVRYAAEDIHKIHLLYKDMVNSGYIPAIGLEEKSAVYVKQHNKARPRPRDRFKRHPLLPLTVFHSITTGDTIQCQGCESELPPNVFSPGVTKNHRLGRTLCFVCQVVECHDNYMNQARF